MAPDDEKTAPDIDYTGVENVKDLLTFDQRKAVTEKASQLSAGDSVRINDRVRPLTVVPKEDTTLLEMAYEDTIFLKGNGTEYRIKIGHHSVPELDRGQFTQSEYVGFLTVLDDAEADS
ncbi:hypothetical protein [Natrinema sp. CBA1119]|uniref:hypothetical protein n=1 Tax=Natrinema sp. CBA1119 TaxID=1608465 RepID=UPI0011454DD0|nr:hypothetical protein [Natrinema sp. CBA1119]